MKASISSQLKNRILSDSLAGGIWVAPFAGGRDVTSDDSPRQAFVRSDPYQGICMNTEELVFLQLPQCTVDSLSFFRDRTGGTAIMCIPLENPKDFDTGDTMTIGKGDLTITVQTSS